MGFDPDDFALADCLFFVTIVGLIIFLLMNQAKADQPVPVVQGTATYTCMRVSHKQNKMDCVITIDVPPVDNSSEFKSNGPKEKKKDVPREQKFRKPEGTEGLYIPKSSTKLGI